MEDAPGAEGGPTKASKKEEAQTGGIGRTDFGLKNIMKYDTFISS